MTVLAGSSDSPPTPQLCSRCKETGATLELRNAESVCPSCFANFVSTKAIKRLEVLQRETRPAGSQLPSAPQRYLVALSCGPSSTALLHILHESLRRRQQGQGQEQEQRKGRGKEQRRPRFELVVVYVAFDAAVVESGSNDDNGNDKDSSTEEQELLDRYRARFPGAEIQTVDLSSVVGSPSINWSTLPLDTLPLDSSRSLHPSLTTSTTRRQRRKQLADLFTRLPSPTSRADVRRLLTRHALLAAAAQNHCDVVLQGYSTTALAELTLGEAAKGRGFSLPWVVNDGPAFPIPVPAFNASNLDGEDEGGGGGGGGEGAIGVTKTIPIYYPLRELFRKELLSYASTTTPPLIELLATNNSHLLPNNNGAVVSHKDLSIDDVMARYFAEVEVNYPSVVANVVRTTGKLSRAAGEENESEDGGTVRCGLCGIVLDRVGDERWRGEIGESSSQVPERTKSLCYGCERSIRA